MPGLGLARHNSLCDLLIAPLKQVPRACRRSAQAPPAPNPASQPHSLTAAHHRAQPAALSGQWLIKQVIHRPRALQGRVRAGCGASIGRGCLRCAVGRPARLRATWT